MKELYVSVLGNVDSGKSTLIGVLTTNEADDGRGRSRRSVFVYPHEIKTGRTSSISYRWNSFGENKIVFVDLAGHARYLKTTISGMTSTYPSFAILCIDNIITKVTREHLGLILRLKIPFLIVLTKADFRRDSHEVIGELKKLLLNLRKRIFEIKTNTDTLKVVSSEEGNLVPLLRVSNITLEGHSLLREILSHLEQSPLPRYQKKFVVDHRFSVRGIGTVISGFNGGPAINEGDLMYLGPFGTGEFLKIIVKSIHNEYRESIKTLNEKQRGSLAIRVDLRPEFTLRNGMILSHCKEKSYTKIRAKIKILTSQPVTLNVNSVIYLHCGAFRGPGKLETLENLNSGEKLVTIRMFLPFYLEEDLYFVFREGRLIGEGLIVSLC